MDAQCRKKDEFFVSSWVVEVQPGHAILEKPSAARDAAEPTYFPRTADGRRVPLMLNVVFYAVISVLCGLAPSYRVFLILRMLFGIGKRGFETGSFCHRAVDQVVEARDL